MNEDLDLADDVPGKPVTPTPVSPPRSRSVEPEPETRFEDLPPASVEVPGPSQIQPYYKNGAVRSMPHSLEAEENLISCCLIDGAELIPKCRKANIRVDSFYESKFGLIYECLLDLSNRNIFIDIVVIVEEMKKTGKLDRVGGIAFLTQVSSRIPTTALAAYFINKVAEFASLRELIRVATGAVEQAYQANSDVPELLGRVRTQIDSMTTMALNGHGTPAFTVWKPAQFRAYDPPENINILDGGYVRRRQLTTLIGPPGVGKSRLSLWLGCLHITGREFFGLPTQNGPAKWLFFGNENDPTRQKKDLEWFYKSLTAEEQVLVDANLFLHVIDQPDDGIITLTDPDACAKLHATLAMVKPDVVVFDPWGNMIEGNENDNEEVRRTLKILLRALAMNSPDAAIIVIHHARTGKSTVIEAGSNFSGGSLGRGSKALVSSARCELALWPGHSEDSSRLVLTCEKVNNVKKFEPKGIVFENGVYREDPDFDLQAWRDDIEGNRGGKTLTIRDVVELVRGGCMKAVDLVTRCESDFSVSRRTVNTRLAEACEKGYLMRTQPVGSYTLGNAKLPPKIA